MLNLTRPEVCPKSNSYDSPYIIHTKFKEKRQAEERDHPTQIMAFYVSDAFRAVRDKVGIVAKTPESKPPTFHEIRSLGIHLHRKAAKRKAQQLEAELISDQYTPGINAAQNISLQTQSETLVKQVQVLAGHEDVRMTDEYESGHEEQWEEVVIHYELPPELN